MTIYGLSDLTWISIIAIIGCSVAGAYMLIKKKPGLVRSIHDTAKYKNVELYCIKGGKLLIALAIGCLIMLILSLFVNTAVANIFGLVCVCVFGFFWKKMSDEYGPV